MVPPIALVCSREDGATRTNGGQDRISNRLSQRNPVDAMQRGRTAPSIQARAVASRVARCGYSLVRAPPRTQRQACAG